MIESGFVHLQISFLEPVMIQLYFQIRITLPGPVTCKQDFPLYYYIYRVATKLFSKHELGAYINQYLHNVYIP